MNKFIDELTMASYESEIDLDRDVPGDLAFLEHQNMVDEDEVDVITAHLDDESYVDSLLTTGFDFDKYCEDNPDFNAALNGHPDYI